MGFSPSFWKSDIKTEYAYLGVVCILFTLRLNFVQQMHIINGKTGKNEMGIGLINVNIKMNHKGV